MSAALKKKKIKRNQYCLVVHVDVNLFIENEVEMGWGVWGGGVTVMHWKLIQVNGGVV